MDGMLDKALMIIIILAAVFLLSATILLPFFNTVYSYVVTGLSAATTQGMFLFLLFIGLIAIILGILKAVKGK